MDIDTETSFYQRIDVLEAEKHSLLHQIKQLENGLDKEKKFHRKFVEDVIQSEELRNLDFEKQRKELLEENKRLLAVNRQLTIDKTFYKTSYDSLIDDEDRTKPNQSKETATSSDSVSNYSTANESVPAPSSSQRKKTKTISKLSEQMFDENKRLKLRTTKLSRDNALLRLKVKQLENFKNKIQNKKVQQEKYKNELQNLLESTRRTNGQIFNSVALSKLADLSRD